MKKLANPKVCLKCKSAMATYAAFWRGGSAWCKPCAVAYAATENLKISELGFYPVKAWKYCYEKGGTKAIVTVSYWTTGDRDYCQGCRCRA
jgi:hypothetical protein